MHKDKNMINQIEVFKLSLGIGITWNDRGSC